MTPGRHVLAVKAFNSHAAAGMIFGLRIDLAEGRCIEIKSDPSWKIVPKEAELGKQGQAVRTWRPATVVARIREVSLVEWTPESVKRAHALQPVRVFFWQTAWFQITFLILLRIDRC